MLRRSRGRHTLRRRTASDIEPNTPIPDGDTVPHPGYRRAADILADQQPATPPTEPAGLPAMPPARELPALPNWAQPTMILPITPLVPGFVDPDRR